MSYIEALKAARICEKRVAAQLQHIERLHRIIKATAGRHGTGEYAAEITEKLAGLERELNEQIDIAVDAKREALVWLSFLPAEERLVMERYYILAESWDEIAAATYMSERRVYMLRKSATERLERLSVVNAR